MTTKQIHIYSVGLLHRFASGIKNGIILVLKNKLGSYLL